MELREAIEEAMMSDDYEGIEEGYNAGFLAGIEAAACVAQKAKNSAEKTALKHPENSENRDRMFARAREAEYIEAEIRSHSPSDKPAAPSVTEAAKVLVENFGGVVHREFNKSGWGSQAAKEALKALAEQKEGE